MKKRMLVAFMACITMMFVSCNKEKELNATSWKAHTVVSQDMVVEGINAHAEMTMDATMKFTDATNGTMTVTTSGVITAFGMPMPIEESTDTENFTYTFDGIGGTLTLAQGEDSETIPFTYNKKDNTILISISEVDEETGMEFALELLFTEE